MPFLDEIAAKLVAAGVGVQGTNIFLGSGAVIPTGAGPYLSITETGGAGAGLTHNGTPVEMPTAQLVARAASYAIARAMLKAAYDALGGANGLRNVTLSGTFYQKVKPRQNITDIGLDDSARRMLSYNIEVEKAPS